MVKVYKRGEEFQIVVSDMNLRNHIWEDWLFFYIGKYLKKEIDFVPFYYSDNPNNFYPPQKTKLIRTYKGGDAKRTAKYIVKLL